MFESSAHPNAIMQKQKNNNMKTIENNKEEIKNYLENLSVNELVSIHNEYCDSAKYMDDYIYYNDEAFFVNHFGENPMEVARAISFGDYRYQDDFVKFNGYGNLDSFQEYNVDNVIDIDAIVEDIIENSQNYYSLTLI